MSRATGRPPGRPRRVGEPRISVSAHITAAAHDELIRAAAAADVSVAAIVRAAIHQWSRADVLDIREGAPAVPPPGLDDDR